MKYGYIDSIRGIAILMVIFLHTGQRVDGLGMWLVGLSGYGQMGVQLFFVASAYTLCLSWLGRTDEPNKTRDFFIRRFFRIAPLYYLGIVLYAGISVGESLFDGNGAVVGYQYSPINVLANVLLIHGLYPPANNVIVPGGWSIGTEVIFYALFPLLIFVLSKKTRNPIGASVIAFILSVVLSQAALLAILEITGKVLVNNKFLYFSVLVQLPVFILGMAYYFMNTAGKWPVRSINGNAFGLMAATAVAGAIWIFAGPYAFSLIPAVSGVSFLFLFALCEKADGQGMRFIRWIGTLSYSMYIFHWFFAHTLTERLSGRLAQYIGPDLTLAVLYPAAVACTVLLAWLSHRFLETRFIHLGKAIIARMDARTGAAKVVPLRL